MNDYLTPPVIELNPEWEVAFDGDIITPHKKSRLIDEAVIEINSTLEEEYFELYRTFPATRKLYDLIVWGGWVLEVTAARPDFKFVATRWIGKKQEIEGTFPEILKKIFE